MRRNLYLLASAFAFCWGGFALALQQPSSLVASGGGGVGQGNGFTAFSSAVIGVSFTYPKRWELHESADQRQVHVDNSPLASQGQKISHVDFSVSYDLFQQSVRSTEEMKEILAKRWPDRSWAYVTFRTGPTGYAWQGRSANQAYLGEYYLLDPKHRVLKISYEAYEDLNGSDAIKGIVASVAVSDHIDCDYSVFDVAGRAVFQGTDHLSSQRTFDMDYSESKAPDGLIHVTSTKGSAAAAHVFLANGKRVIFDYDLGFRLALVNYIDHDSIYHAQSSCFGLSVKTGDQTVVDGCVSLGDDPRYWIDRESTSFLLGAPALNFKWIAAKNLQIQGLGTVQVSCREGADRQPLPGAPVPVLAYAYRNPELNRGRIVELQGEGGDVPALGEVCGSSAEKCQCGFYRMPSFDFDPPLSNENRIDKVRNRFFCAIPEEISPEEVKYVVLARKTGPPFGSSSLTFITTVESLSE